MDINIQHIKKISYHYVDFPENKSTHAFTILKLEIQDDTQNHLINMFLPAGTRVARFQNDYPESATDGSLLRPVGEVIDYNRLMRGVDADLQEVVSDVVDKLAHGDDFSDTLISKTKFMGMVWDECHGWSGEKLLAAEKFIDQLRGLPSDWIGLGN